MGKLTNLLKYKKEIQIKDDKGQLLRDDDGNPVVVYMRVIGDKDLEEAQKAARVASALRRATLLDDQSEDHLINVKIFEGAEEAECRSVIQQAQAANWSSEAYAVVIVPDLPKIDEIARDPDAPTLEELEKLDKAIGEAHADYQNKIQEYIQTKLTELEAALEDKSIEELREMAKSSIVILLSIETYLNVLRDEKVWRSVYDDNTFYIREFKNIDEFLNLHLALKEQLQDEYERLEAGFDDIKN